MARTLHKGAPASPLQVKHGIDFIFIEIMINITITSGYILGI